MPEDDEDLEEIPVVIAGSRFHAKFWCGCVVVALNQMGRNGVEFGPCDAHKHSLILRDANWRTFDPSGMAEFSLDGSGWGESYDISDDQKAGLRILLRVEGQLADELLQVNAKRRRWWQRLFDM